METLNQYLENWDLARRKEHSKIALFDPTLSRNLTSSEKKHFVKVFYHLRGHFHDFLWFVASHAPNAKAKRTILENIEEELGGNRKSHEQLYFDFAHSFGVDLKDEVVNQTSYVLFAREFNRKHLEYLANSDWDGKVIAFAAYERLDNVDYADLLSLAKSIGATKEALTFFTVHAQVQHYEMARDKFSLENLWDRNDQEVREGFSFIGDHQNQMWRDLSDSVFRYDNNNN